MLQKDWQSQMADVLERLADPGHNGDRLRRILLTPLSAAPYRQVVLDLLDRRKLRLRPGHRWRSSPVWPWTAQYVNLMRNQINHALGDSSNRGKMHALNRLGYHANLGRLTTQELSSFFLESVGRLEHLGREVKAASGAPLPQPPESPIPPGHRGPSAPAPGKGQCQECYELYFKGKCPRLFFLNSPGHFSMKKSFLLHFSD